MAEGDVTVQPDGSLLYVVAEGDASAVVCERFGLVGSELSSVDTSKTGYSCGVVIYAGETLKLSRQH